MGRSSASRRSSDRGEPTRGGDTAGRGDPVRVVIADDTALLRQGIARLLVDAGIDVVGEAGDAPSLLELVADLGPDVAVVDIRMPPGQSDEGLVAADTIRAHFPDTGVLVLSQYVESAYALRLLEDGEGGCGYLLKDRVLEAIENARGVPWQPAPRLRGVLVELG